MPRYHGYVLRRSGPRNTASARLGSGTRLSSHRAQRARRRRRWLSLHLGSPRCALDAAGRLRERRLRTRGDRCPAFGRGEQRKPLSTRTVRQMTGPIESASAHRLLVLLPHGRCLARFGLGAPGAVALTSAAHVDRVALIWPAQPGFFQGLRRCVLAANVRLPDQRSKGATALAAYGGLLHRVYQGDGENQLWRATCQLMRNRDVGRPIGRSTRRSRGRRQNQACQACSALAIGSGRLDPRPQCQSPVAMGVRTPSSTTRPP